MTFVLPAAACLAGCGQGAPRVEGEPVAYEAVSGGPRGSCFRRGVRGVVHDADGLRRMMENDARCFAAADSADFAGTAILVYALGATPWSTEIRLDRLVREADGTLAASVKVSGKKPGCSQPAGIQFPAIVVRVPASSDSARFVVTHRSRRC